MKLSTRTRCGTTLLFDMAMHDQPRLSLGEMASRQQLSRTYLEKLIAPLLAGGIIKSARGAKGGMWLTRPLSDIRLAEVFFLLEGEDLLLSCLNNPESCKFASTCVTREVWGDVARGIRQMLNGITLEDIMTRYRSKMESRGITGPAIGTGEVEGNV